MNRKTNVLNFVITMALTLLALFWVIHVSNKNYQVEMVDALLKIFLGAVVAGFFHAFFHELGHLIFGKKSGFVFSSMTVWFLRWKKVKNKIKFEFCPFGDEAGYTEMIPSSDQDLSTRLKNITIGGSVFTLALTLLGIPALFISRLSLWIFAFWSMLFPVGVYMFFDSILPSINYGVRNDGAVLYGLKKNDDVAIVTLNILKIQSLLYNGKTPKEIDESLYFDLPQLPEDDNNFILLLNLRYAYYLDKEDYENAKKVTARLEGLMDDISKYYHGPIMTDALYNACTFDFNEKKADEITEDYEKFLNNVNNSSTIRAKLAYLTYVKGETEAFDIFYKKGLKEASRCQLRGIAILEEKLLEKIKKDVQEKTK